MVKTKAPQDEVGLLAAVRADRGSDGPLLIYADWLEETGLPERAEYLRLSVELSRTDRRAPGFRETAQRLAKLEEATQRRWDWSEGGAVRPPELSGVRWEGLERGLPRVAEFWMGKTLAREGARVARESVADQAHVSSPWTEGGAKALADLRDWGSFWHLTLRRVGGRDNDLDEFLGRVGPRLPKSLRFLREGFGRQQIEQLVASSQWPGLRQFGTGRTRGDWNTAVQLAKGLEKAKNLETLSVVDSSFGARGALAIVRSLGASSITRLELGLYDLDSAAATDWVRAGDFSRLKALELIGERVRRATETIGPGLATALAQSPGVSGLESLALRRTSIEATGARALGASPHLAGLRHLDLEGDSLDEATAHVLANAPALNALESLRLHCPEEGTARAALQERWPFVVFGPRGWNDGRDPTRRFVDRLDELRRRRRVWPLLSP